jgi:hypothetical protein
VDVPPPLLLCGLLDGDCRLPEPLDELLPEELLPEELLPDELPLLPEPLDPELDVPELDVPEPDVPEPDVPEPELDDPVEPDDEPVPVVVTAAWLVPGKITATAPAASTLAADTVTVAAFSRRRPRSRSATACATRRAAFGSFWLFTSLVLHALLQAVSEEHLRMF